MVLINAAIDFILRTVLRRVSVDEVHQIVLKASRFRGSSAAKRQYVKDRLLALEHQCPEHVINMVTELAVFQVKAR